MGTQEWFYLEDSRTLFERPVEEEIQQRELQRTREIREVVIRMEQARKMEEWGRYYDLDLELAALLDGNS